MPRSFLVGAVSAAVFWVFFVFCLASFFTDPQTPIALALSPIYAVFFGLPIGIIHASASAIRKKSKGRVVAFVALPITAVLLLIYIWLLIAEVAESFGN